MSRLPNGLQGALRFDPPQPVPVQMIGLALDQLVCMVAAQQHDLNPHGAVQRAIEIVAETAKAHASGQTIKAVQDAVATMGQQDGA